MIDIAAERPDTAVNRTQIGGNHYKTRLEHWDFVTVNRLNYLEGNATKYLSRAEKKAGLQDYQKALHYVRKLIAVRQAYLSELGRFRRWAAEWFPMWAVDPVLSPAAFRHEHLQLLDEFLEANSVPKTPGVVIAILSDWDRDEDLMAAESILSDYICERFGLTEPV